MIFAVKARLLGTGCVPRLQVCLRAWKYPSVKFTQVVFASSVVVTTQSLQNPLVTEYTLNYDRNSN